MSRPVSSPPSLRPVRSRPARSLAAALVTLAALLAALLAPLSPGAAAPGTTAAPTADAVDRTAPARAAARVRLSVRGTKVAGAKLTLVAKVRPKAKGRTVVFSVKSGKKWKSLGKARTNKAGVAKKSTRALKKAGTHTVRAVAKKHKRQKQRQTTTKVRLAAKPVTTGQAATLHAPQRVTTGSVFEMVVEVGVKSTVRSGVLSLVAPARGRQVTPPEDVRIRNGKGSVTLGTVPRGEPRLVTLRWQAPAKPGRLEVTATLAAVGVSDRLRATVEVVEEPAGSYQADHGLLARHRAVDSLPTDPEDLNAVCSGSGQAVPAFAKAVQAANAWARSQETAGQRGEWLKAPQAKTSAGLLHIFAMAALDERPGAMMAAALRGHQLAPKDSRHLNNAGMAANLIGKHGWAVAFLTKAAGLPVAPAAGMPQDAVRLNNLGQAWARMGDAGKAVTHLRRALLLDPENPILQRQLAIFLVCQDRNDEALDLLRSSDREEDVPDEVERSERGWADADRVLDMSPSLSGGLELMDVPPTLEKLVGLEGRNGVPGAEQDRISAERSSLLTREIDLRGRLFQQQLDQHPAQVRRTNSLIARTGGPNSVASAAVQEAYLQVSAAQAALRDVCFDTVPYHPDCNIDSETDDVTCAEHQQLFQAWRTRALAFRDSILAYHRVAWPAWTGIQGNLADPVAHELAGVQMRQSMLSLIHTLTADLTHRSDTFRGYNSRAKELPTGATCTVPTVVEPDEEPTNELEDAEADRCSDEVSPWSLEIPLKVLSLKLNCEKLEIEADVDWKVIAGFAKLELSRNPQGYIRSSIVVGSKIDIEGAAFESAFYVERDRQAKVRDVGWVVGPELELAAGPIVHKFDEDKVKFSFLNAHEGLGL